MNHNRNKFASRTLRLEELENRSYLSGMTPDAASWYALPATDFVNPGVQEQELLEWINLFRADPQGELDRLLAYCDANEDPLINNAWNNKFFLARNSAAQTACINNGYPTRSQDDLSLFISQFTSLTPAQPLAFNSTLQSVAKEFTAALTSGSGSGYLHHNENLSAELAGEFGSTYGENVYGNFSQYDQNSFSVASFIHTAFTIDWGNPDGKHRNNSMNSDFREVGISILSQGKSSSYYFSTVDFGTSQTLTGEGGYLLGVVYNDSNANGYYSAGEGQASASMAVKNLSTGETVSFNAFNSGGYQIYLQNGTYEISWQGKSTMTQVVSISGTNVKIDFETGERSGSDPADAPVLDLGTGEAGNYSVTVNYPEGSGVVQTIPNVSISDSDSEYLYQATVTFDTRPDGMEETIDLTPGGGLKAQYNATANQWLLYGKGKLKDYEAALQTLTYEHSRKEANLTTNRVITLAVSDGVNWSNTASITLAVEESGLTLEVAENKVYEGDDGSVWLTFTALLNHAVRGDDPVEFRWTTATTGTAVPGMNFIAGSGKATFYKGEYQKTFTVAIQGNYTRQKEGGIYSASNDLTIDVTLESLSESLTCVATKVKGTIIDDDTPLLEITEKSWKNPAFLPFQTQYGTQRFVYAVTAPETGLISWSASSELPGGFEITAYETAYSANPLVSGVKLTSTETGKRLQVSAKKDATYLFVLTRLGESGSATIYDQSMTFLPITIAEEEAVIDLGDVSEAALAFDNAGQMELRVDDELWVLGQDDQTDTIRFTASSNDDSPKFLVSLDGQTGSIANSGNAEGNSSRFQLGNQTYDFDGFVVIEIDGSDALEAITFTGSGGDDQLTFASGKGSFVTSVGESYQQTYLFSNVTNITFNGGTGGNDTAKIGDSRESDLLAVAENSLDLIGGGYHLAVTDFNRVNLSFENGGTNSVTVNTTVKTTNILAGALYLMSGDMNGRTTGNNVFTYDIRQFSHFEAITVTDMTVAASESDMTYRVTPGTLLGNSVSAGRSIRILEAQNLTLVGFSPDASQPVVTISKTTPDDDADVTFDDSIQQNVTEVVHTGDKATFTLKITGDWTDKIKAPTAAAALPERAVDTLFSRGDTACDALVQELVPLPILATSDSEPLWSTYEEADDPLVLTPALETALAVW
ncbi:MAG: hypothetical protein Q4G68_10820 [Planctomycetia bacterium]|nr:hypothetical protein [Planctomycetia bacterium]